MAWYKKNNNSNHNNYNNNNNNNNNYKPYNNNNNYNNPNKAKKCKFGCNRSCAPGRTNKGNRFDTCCRSCAMTKGGNKHDNTCNQRNGAVNKYKPKPKPKYNNNYNNYNNNNNNNNNNDDQKNGGSVDNQLALFTALLSLAVVEDAGFCMASEKNRIALIKRLKSISPSGQTALRDAVMIGITHLLKVKNILVKLGAIKHKFVHIVLTDGEDTASTESQHSLGSVFVKLGKELGDYVRTYFIGVGLSYQAKRDLDIIAKLGGNSCETFNCQDVGINDVFNRIKLNLGIRRNVILSQNQNNQIVAHTQNQLVAQVSAQKFLVLFTLDKSGSMAGGRWRRVVQAVAGFCVGMKQHDILGCVLFNEKAVIIS